MPKIVVILTLLCVVFNIYYMPRTPPDGVACNVFMFGRARYRSGICLSVCSLHIVIYFNSSGMDEVTLSNLANGSSMAGFTPESGVVWVT